MRAANFWNEAMSLETYIKQMSQNQQMFRENLEAVELTDEERGWFRDRRLRFLVLTEDFCGDSAQFIPVVGKLSRDLDTVDIGILRRDQYLELASNYRRPDGYQAIPVLIMIDDDGDELGFLVERPARATEALAAETRRFARENAHLDGINRNIDRMPEATRMAVKQHSAEWRGSQTCQWTRWLLEDLRAIGKKPSEEISAPRR